MFFIHGPKLSVAFCAIAPPPRQGCATPGFGPPLTRLRGINRTGHHAIVTPQKSAPPYLRGFRPPFTTASPIGDVPHDELLLKSSTDCLRSPTPFCTFPEICFESPLICCSLLPTSLPVCSWTLPTTSFATPFTWSLFMFDCSCCKRYTQRARWKIRAISCPARIKSTRSPISSQFRRWDHNPIPCCEARLESRPPAPTPG